jgi:hypothetical protein
MLKKVKSKVYEKDVVMFILLVELFIALLVIL